MFRLFRFPLRFCQYVHYFLNLSPPSFISMSHIRDSGEMTVSIMPAWASMRKEKNTEAFLNAWPSSVPEYPLHRFSRKFASAAAHHLKSVRLYRETKLSRRPAWPPQCSRDPRRNVRKLPLSPSPRCRPALRMGLSAYRLPATTQCCLSWCHAWKVLFYGHVGQIRQKPL